MTAIIVAASENNVIGNDNDLLWRLPTDMAYFKEQTMGGTVIMGRKTWESIPEKYRPLEGRVNIVVSRQENYTGNCIVVNSLAKALKKSSMDRKTFIIGGGEIYKESLKFVDTVYMTRVHTTIDGDTTFPELKDGWVLESELNVKQDNRNKHNMTFQVFKRG